VKDDALLLYCERVEHEFFRLKGRRGTLSPADFARAQEWYRAGVPLEAALAAIGHAFENRAGGRDRGVEEVNSLAFCESFFAERGRRPRS
jgi:hypothetical protein